MVPLPQIHDGRLCYCFLYDTAIFVVLVDAGAIVLVIGYVLVLGLYDETEASYLEPPAIILMGDTEALCGMLFDIELIDILPCAVL